MTTRKDDTTRVRDGGRRVFVTSTGSERVEACRTIVSEKAFAKVDGVVVDQFTASAVVAVYDGLNEKNRETFVGFPISKMASVAFKLLK